jgi:hypothetical protein
MHVCARNIADTCVYFIGVYYYAVQGLEAFLNALMRVQPGVKGALADQIKTVSRNMDVLSFLGCTVDGNQVTTQSHTCAAHTCIYI